MIGRFVCIAVFLFGSSMPVVTFASPEIPGAPQTAPIALVGGTVYPVSGPTIEGGVVLFRRGRISYVGRKRSFQRAPKLSM